MITSNTTSQTYDLGNHVLEISDKYTLIASYPNASDPISEAVQLDHEEAYKLCVALQASFVQAQAIQEEQRQNQDAWRDYCALPNLSKQLPYVDRMNCVGCGTEHLVAKMSDAGRCMRCYCSEFLVPERY